MELGCPLNNLAQEMSPIDEEFRRRLEQIFAEWRAGIAAALERGRRAGRVRKEVEPDVTGAFIVAAFEGAIGSVKTSRNRELARMILSGLEEYIESLRPTRRVTKPASRRIRNDKE
jgi:hypothetical protein